MSNNKNHLDNAGFMNAEIRIVQSNGARCQGNSVDPLSPPGAGQQVAETWSEGAESEGIFHKRLGIQPISPPQGKLAAKVCVRVCVHA